VELRGLQGAKELNGERGVAIKYFEDKGRWQVRLVKKGQADNTCTGGEQYMDKTIKPQNLVRLIKVRR
jgi:hypothetical protein